VAGKNSRIGQVVRESITAWCEGCGGMSFMPPGVEDPDDPGVEIRMCDDGHQVRTTRYVFTTPKDATRFNIPLN
jgi:hypothetical protein